MNVTVPDNCPPTGVPPRLSPPVSLTRVGPGVKPTPDSGRLTCPLLVITVNVPEDEPTMPGENVRGTVMGWFAAIDTGRLGVGSVVANADGVTVSWDIVAFLLAVRVAAPVL